MINLNNLVRLFNQFKDNIIFIVLASKKSNLNNYEIIKYIFYYVLDFLLNLFRNINYKKEKYKFKDFSKSLKFSKDWFTNNIPVWISIFKKFVKKENVKILEIGSFEGMSATFFLNYFNKSEIDCVETFKGSDEHSNTNFNQIKSNFNNNLLNFKSRFKIYETTSDNFFKEKNVDETYDIIYIDGSHESTQVLKDAENSLKNLNKHGIIIFDDFLRKYYDEIKKNPFFAIVNFIKTNKENIRILYVGYQLILQKC